jgi:hypothetical protein
MLLLLLLSLSKRLGDEVVAVATAVAVSLRAARKSGCCCCRCRCRCRCRLSQNGPEMRISPLQWLLQLPLLLLSLLLSPSERLGNESVAVAVAALLDRLGNEAGAVAVAAAASLGSARKWGCGICFGLSPPEWLGNEAVAVPVAVAVSPNRWEMRPLLSLSPLLLPSLSGRLEDGAVHLGACLCPTRRSPLSVWPQWCYASADFEPPSDQPAVNDSSPTNRQSRPPDFQNVHRLQISKII